MRSWHLTPLLSGVIVAACLCAGPEAHADTNAKLLTVGATSSGAPTLSVTGNYTDWNKQYYRVLPGGWPNQAAFYNRDAGFVKLLRFAANGDVRTLSTNTFQDQFDEVIHGEFGGTYAKDLLFFQRSTGKVRAYEMTWSGGFNFLFEDTISATPAGGSWDIVSSGYLGHNSYRHDLLLYSRAEGTAQFHRLNGTAFQLQQSFWGWKQNWDQIVPGKFNGDLFTDFLFYNQDGGSQSAVTTGHAKFVSFGSNFQLTTISETVSEWPMSANVIVVPGNFYGNDALTDFLVYDGSAGRATLWFNDGRGDYDSAGSWSMQDRWTNIVALDLDGDRSELLFYTTQKLLNIVPVSLNGALVEDAGFQTWIDAANDAFAPAGIQFNYVNRGWSFTVGDPTQACVRDSVTEVVLNVAAVAFRAQGGQNDVIVYVRNTGGVGCSDAGKQYIVMPEWNLSDANQWTRAGGRPTLADNPKLLVHELGHHFSLPHTQPDAALPAQASVYDWDPDRRDDDDRFTPVFDTAPHPSFSNSPTMTSWWATVVNRCDDSGAGTAPNVNDVFLALTNGTTVRVNPERHNIMSRTINCDTIYRMTPGQIRNVRENLWVARRGYLVGAEPRAPVVLPGF